MKSKDELIIENPPVGPDWPDADGEKRFYLLFAFPGDQRDRISGPFELVDATERQRELYAVCTHAEISEDIPAFRKNYQHLLSK